MKVQLIRVMPAYRRPRRGTNKGFIAADVDGHHVTFVERRGWACTCPDPNCCHVDAVAELIDPTTLERIEGTATTQIGELA